MSERKKKLGELQMMVECLLEMDEMCRSNDNHLILKVAELMCFGQGIDIKYMTFADVINNWNAFNLPSFESITRCRRKVQEKYPSLQAKPLVKEARAEEEEVFREVMSNV